MARIYDKIEGQLHRDGNIGKLGTLGKVVVDSVWNRERGVEESLEQRRKEGTRMMGKDNTANSIPNIPRPHLLRRKSIRTGKLCGLTRAIKLAAHFFTRMQVTREKRGGLCDHSASLTFNIDACTGSFFYHLLPSSFHWMLLYRRVVRMSLP